MTPEQLNTVLVMELINYQTTNTLNDDLRRLFLECIIIVSKKERYKNLSDNLRIYSEAKAYEDLCRHSVHYNHEKSDKAFAYICQIIQSSFACMVGKHGKCSKTIKS